MQTTQIENLVTAFDELQKSIQEDPRPDESKPSALLVVFHPDASLNCRVRLNGDVGVLAQALMVICSENPEFADHLFEKLLEQTSR